MKWLAEIPKLQLHVRVVTECDVCVIFSQVQEKCIDLLF